MWPVIEGCV